MRNRMAGLLAGRLRAPASLGAKLVLILTGVGLIGAVALTLLLAAVITPSFNQLEQTEISDHVGRTNAALTDYASKVEHAVSDYGDWNSSYDYMGHQTRAFEQDSFSTLAMANLAVNGMAYVANDGHIVIARWIDLKNQADVPALRARLVAAIPHLDLTHVVSRSPGGHSGAFYLRIGDTLSAVGVARVRKSDGTGTPRGYVLMVRTIGSDQLTNLLKLKAGLDLAYPVSEVTVTPRPRSPTSPFRSAAPTAARSRPLPSPSRATSRCSASGCLRSRWSGRRSC